MRPQSEEVDIIQANATLATYTYDATGNKLRNSGSDGGWDYIDGIVYQNGAISFIQNEEGRASLQGSLYHYEYNLKDHLGNVRYSFDKDPTSGTARRIQEDEYYSFGLRATPVVYDFSNNNRYLYNGQEIQTDLTSLYNYGARFYDPVIARWATIDPKADAFNNLSPYNYGLNNPISFVDIDGKGPTDPGTFWQRIMAFFGFGVRNQPSNAEEAREFSERAQSLKARSDVLEARKETLMKTADWVPFLGAILHVSNSAVTGKNSKAALGIGMGLIDAIGGEGS